MVQCSKCKSVVKDEKLFCPECGSPVEYTPKKSQKRNVGWLIAAALMALALVGGVSYYLGSRQTNTKSISEEELLKRAKYIVSQVPDHKEFENVDHTVFSKDLCDVLTKTDKLYEHLCDIGWDGIFLERHIYWFRSQDWGEYDCAKLNVLTNTCNTAEVVFQYYTIWSQDDTQEYANCYIMKLIKENGEFVLDDWIAVNESGSEYYSQKEALIEDYNVCLSEAHSNKFQPMVIPPALSTVKINADEFRIWENE